MLEIVLLYIFIGAVVGIAVGLTGIGGGLLMTPLLILFGVPPATAVGTDLFFCAGTKSFAMWIRHINDHIRWPIVFLLLAGSIPASILTTIALTVLEPDHAVLNEFITITLGILLIICASVILTKELIDMGQEKEEHEIAPVEAIRHITHNHIKLITISIGFLLGAFVTITSIGAGALGTMALFILFPKLRAVDIIGTDIAHAVPLTLVAGIGHFTLGNVDPLLLLALLAGSIPFVWLASFFTKYVPQHMLRIALIIILIVIGLKFTISYFWF